ncbi:MAG TPA: ATP-binding protein, partial [Plasticicumulans sp.]|nr:ATP-binding protein [Plasticicumulans sp.]
VVIANSHAEHLFGYAPGELDGQPVEMLLPERLRSMHVTHRAHYRAQPHARPMGAGLELAARRRDGSEFPVEISLSPLATEVGPMTMSAIRDVTERKRFEKALQEKNHELAAANQAKTQFLASMSHELRTPLNAIIGFTGALLMKLSGPLTSVQEEQLKLVQSSGKHLLALIGDLLDLARIEAGRIDLTPEPLDAVAITNEVVASLRPQAVHKGLALNVAHEAPVLALHADRRALTQILINLIGNAIKFTERGHVHVHSERAFDSDGRALVRIAIEDTGLGIRPEEQAQLFEAFARGLVAKRAGIEGTGLGLHLSRKLTLLLGGNLSLRSEFGSGSTFTLELPAGPAAG